MKDKIDPILTLQAVNIRFGGIHALKNIHFNVKRNSITALIGPNGAGKTTLFNCITGFYRAKGKLLFHLPEKTFSLPKVLGEPFHLSHFIHPIDFFACLYYKMFGGSHLVTQAGIARTFQTIRLFREMTVIENLLVAQYHTANKNLLAGLFNLKGFQRWEKSAIDAAFLWLEKFDLLHEANRLAGELSYRQQRYLEIARSMCLLPKLLCLDEPAAGLNKQETEGLQILLQTLRKEYNLTILLIEHDMSLVMKVSDHIIVLDQGSVISEGSPKEVREDKKVISAYLGEKENEEKKENE